MRDTDGDGISDTAEAGTDGDVAIHDHTPPSVTVHSIDASLTRTRFGVAFSVRDPSGLGRTLLVKKGEARRTVQPPPGGATEFFHETGFEVERDAIERIHVGGGSFITGAFVEIEPHDVHDNHDRREYVGPDSFGQAADAIARTPIPGGVGKLEAFQLFSFSSGVTTASGEAVIDLVDLLFNLPERVAEMRELAAYMRDNPAVIEQLPGMMAESVREKQRLQNPFEPGTGRFDTFANGWYLGATTGFLITEVTIGKGLGAVVNRLKNSERLARMARTLRHAVDQVNPGVPPRVVALSGRVKGRLPDVDVDTGRLANVLGRLSHSSQYRMARFLEDIPDSTWRRLDDLDVPKPAARAGRIVNALGAKGRRALVAVSDEGKQAMLRMADDVRTLNRKVTAWERGRISTRELTRVMVRYNRLDAADQRAFARIVQTGGDDAVAGAAKLDDAGFRAMMDADLASGTKARAFRQVTEGELDSSNVRRMGDLVEAGDMDEADVQRMMGMLETKANDPFIGSQITSGELLAIAPKAELSDTRLVAKDGNGRLRWLENNEGANVGFDAILRKHQDDITAAYPDVNSVDDIQSMIFETIANSDEGFVVVRPDPDTGHRYWLRVEDRPETPFRVVVSDNGFILNAFPDSSTNPFG